MIKATLLQGMLGPHLNVEVAYPSELVYCPERAAHSSMMDHTWPIWTSAHVWKLQVLQSRCLGVATNAPKQGSNQEIYNYVEDPLLADIIRTAKV